MWSGAEQPAASNGSEDESQTGTGESAATWALALLMAAVAAGFGALVGTLDSAAPAVGVPWIVLAAMFVLTAAFVVQLPYGRGSYAVSLAEIPLFLGLLALSPSALILTRVGGAAIGLPLRGLRGATLAYRLAGTALEAAVVVGVHRAVLDDAAPLGPHGLLAMALAGVALIVLANVMADPAASLRAHTASLVEIPDTISAASTNVLANIGLAMITAIVVAHDPVMLLAVVPVVGAVAALYLAWTKVHQRLTHLQHTHEFIAALGSARGATATMTTVLAETAKLLRAGTVEIVLIDDGDTISTRLVGGGLVTEIGKPTWCRAAIAGETRLLVGDETLGVRRQSGLGTREAIVIGLPPTPHGAISAMLVADRIGGGSFDADDVQMIELLAGHASTRIQADGLIEAVRAEGAEKEYQSLHDYLTGLPNRRHFMERTVDALTEHETLAVMMIDLDRFKQINDTLGHSAGDRVLIAAASRLVGRLSVGVDALIARLGGDEFAVLLCDADTHRAAEVAADLRAALTVPLQLDGLSIEIGASIGVAVAPVHGRSAEVLLQRADVAMYVAKQAQQGVEVYSRDRDDNDVRGLALVTELRRDLDEDALDVYFQPLVALSTGVVHGVESLVRWTSASYGSVAPDEFIPMAETTGLINLLTERVLRRSLAQAAAWRAQGIHLNVAVNLSPKNLLAGDMVDLVVRCLADAGVPGNVLTLELTESCLVGDIVSTAAILQDLRDQGVRISIDDFGTGYSSLSYLSKLPVDEVKIDKSFVQAIGTDGTAIMRAATHLAHELNLNVVAEGVEDVDTWHALADLGCDIAQGFLLSRPKPAAELTEWLIRHTQVSGAPRVDIPARAHEDEHEHEEQDGDDATVDVGPVANVHLLRRAARG